MKIEMTVKKKKSYKLHKTSQEKWQANSTHLP